MGACPSWPQVPGLMGDKLTAHLCSLLNTDRALGVGTG